MANEPSAEQLKADGNGAFKAFKLQQAIDLHSQAVAAAPNEAVYLANRSAALFEAGEYAAALSDIERAFQLQPAASLASKLALRAAKCCIWQQHPGQASAWHEHEALNAQQQPNDLIQLRELAAACAQAQGPEQPAQVHAEGEHPAPSLLKELIMPERPEMFTSGDDDARSMLAGAPVTSGLTAATLCAMHALQYCGARVHCRRRTLGGHRGRAVASRARKRYEHSTPVQQTTCVTRAQPAGCGVLASP